MSNSAEDVVGTITTATPITREIIHNILSAADDCGGIDYWAFAKVGTIAEGTKPEFFTEYVGLGGTWIIGITADDVPAAKPDGEWPKEILDADDGQIVVPSGAYDLDELDLYTLTMEKIVKGIQLHHEHRAKQGTMLDLEDIDETEADCILQWGLFGDIIYG